MRFIKFSILACILSGCAQQPIQQQEGVNEPAKSTVNIEPEPKVKVDPRVAYLKDQAVLTGSKLENFYEMDNLFGVMKALQDGKLTTSDLKDALFYFNDPDGYDSGYLYNSTYFKCIQVIDMGELENNEGNKVPVFMALYTNSQIDMTVTVWWYGTRPLQGQKLNVDFLMFDKAGTYKNKKDEDRTEVVFSRPKWAGSNGYSYY